MSEQDATLVTAQPGDSEHPPRTPEAIAAEIVHGIVVNVLWFVGEERVKEWNALVAAVTASQHIPVSAAAEMDALAASLLDALPPYRRTDFRRLQDYHVCDLAAIHEQAA